MKKMLQTSSLLLGSGHKGADDLCSHTYGRFSPPPPLFPPVEEDVLCSAQLQQPHWMGSGGVSGNGFGSASFASHSQSQVSFF